MKKTQKWITENFEELVDNYGGKYVAVVGEKVIAAARTPKEAREAATKVAQEEEISLLKVPREEELVCIL
jgi:GTP cyclohydrolase III